MTRNRALLVGINAYPSAPLLGCINDVYQMKQLLIQYYQFTEENICVLLDSDATAENIQNRLAWLAEGEADPAAVRVFHYSGHGSYVADQNGDEPDGRDECLVPYDYKTAGMITDDALKILYDRFPRAGNLTLIMDSCHSGSVNRMALEDIRFRFLPVPPEEQRQIAAAKAKFEEDQYAFVTGKILQLREEKWTEAELEVKIGALINRFKKKRFGDIRMREANILLAGCAPDQQSADACIDNDYHGAFTYHLVKAVTQANGELTYHQLAERTGDMLYRAGFAQVPQLEYRGKSDQQKFLPIIR